MPVGSLYLPSHLPSSLFQMFSPCRGIFNPPTISLAINKRIIVSIIFLSTNINVFFVQYLLFFCYNVPNFVDNLTRNHYNFYCDVTEIYVSIYVFFFTDIEILRKRYVVA